MNESNRESLAGLRMPAARSDGLSALNDAAHRLHHDRTAVKHLAMPTDPRVLMLPSFEAALG